MARTSLFLITFLFLQMHNFRVNAQSPADKSNYIRYIQTYKDIAIRKMSEYKIPASITLAQGILESGCGNSELTVNANNHFGIKCHKEWTGMTYTMDDDEKNECFRKYASAEESYNDHSYFLTTRPRYAPLFALDIRDYKGWANGLKNTGYATNPKYAEMLIRIIEENELYLFDSEPKGPVAEKEKEEKPVREEVIATEYSGPKNKAFTFLEVAEGNRKIYVNNNVKLIYARKDDTPHTIARDLGIHVFQVLGYNELGKNEEIRAGQVIYIEPKKRKASQETHVLNKGETMRDVSQLYGVRLKALYKKNGLAEGHEPSPGTTLYLKKTKPD
ncbi:MAG: Mannosyl-glycoprotein endo-beta-N-acetylglucosamidase [Bacteroidetes bacterium]|nr:MAG: Mannosyl-glycoprotein endo-beta-N-acetylglucosamidase [Bacteroidota bacterium]